ncbi:hypothetical protein AVEN_203808-1 [Araneus ventricosus]|uniref:Uncharacterized protein n=1 Tax=Araneus ventricosus TaxID=182803 RepID=A0A4Y2R551_ARAVE|nr:hypothetical protein AVEN_203808-1 [Araneus ventricosus]
MEQMGLGEPENVQICIKIVKVSEGKIVLNTYIEVNTMELTIANIAYWVLFVIRTTIGASFVLVNFLGALNRQLGTIFFFSIVDGRGIFGELKRQEPEYAHLAENVWCVYVTGNV